MKIRTQTKMIIMTSGMIFDGIRRLLTSSLFFHSLVGPDWFAKKCLNGPEGLAQFQLQFLPGI